MGRLKGWRLQLPQTHLGDDLGRGAPGDLRTKLQVVYSTPLGLLGFPGVSDGKESACNAGDLGMIPESGRFPGEEKGNPL